MKVTVRQMTSWKEALNAARITVGKAPLDKEPSDEWKRKVIRAEHSPIRLVEYMIYLEDIPTFVANHLVRHHEGCEKFVCSHREDRSDLKPDEVNRLTPVSMQMQCNAQALINISRKRLCNCASKETREVWNMVKEEIKKIDPVMAEFMVKECVYRGLCPELKTCGYIFGTKYQQERMDYIPEEQLEKVVINKD